MALHYLLRGWVDVPGHSEIALCRGRCIPARTGVGRSVLVTEEVQQ